VVWQGQGSALPLPYHPHPTHYTTIEKGGISLKSFCGLHAEATVAGEDC